MTFNITWVNGSNSSACITTIWVFVLRAGSGKQCKAGSNVRDLREYQVARLSSPRCWIKVPVPLGDVGSCPTTAKKCFCFPGDSAGKESTCSVGDLGLITGLGRSPGKGKGYPLHCFGLENSMDCKGHGVTKSQTWLSDFHDDKNETFRGPWAREALSSEVRLL